MTDGPFYEVGTSLHNRVDIEADFAVTDRLSIAVGVPFVFAKYDDPEPLPPFVPFCPLTSAGAGKAAGRISGSPRDTTS